MDKPRRSEGIFSTDVLNKDAKGTDPFVNVGGKSGGEFSLKVYQGDQYFDINSGGWGILSNGPGVRLQYYFDGGHTYLKVVSGGSSGKYLSASNNLYVGAYKWGNAIPWSIEQSLDPWVYLMTPWNDQFAGLHVNYGSEVLVWNEATPTKFTLVE